MSLLIFAIGLVQCILFGALYAQAAASRQKALSERDALRRMGPGMWPSLGLVIPMAGEDPRMREAVTSLINQNYEDFSVVLVTAESAEPAAALAASLAEIYPHVSHICAGKARNCGQKNWNMLAGVTALPDVDIYAFCDSTHIAEPVFLRALTLPQARGESSFSVGYHRVAPLTNSLPDLAYAFCVLFMGFLQCIPALTQPWGGAMAIEAAAFRSHRLADLWRHSVVDDCSLAAYLQGHRLRAKFCPAAMLLTIPGKTSFSWWIAWLERQILFLKFCIPDQWMLLGGVCVLLVLPPLLALLALLGALLGLTGASPPLLALLWLVALCASLGPWRSFLPAPIAMTRWLLAYGLGISGFAIAYGRSVLAKVILWRGISYLVGRGGLVRGVRVQK